MICCGSKGLPWCAGRGLTDFNALAPMVMRTAQCLSEAAQHCDARATKTLVQRGIVQVTQVPRTICLES